MTQKDVAKTLLIVVLMIGLAGCGKRADDNGQMVTYRPLPSKIKTMDPGNIGDVYSSRVTAQCIESLYQYHYLKRPHKIIPMLAESMPKISKDGLSYTIKIKKGIYFVDDKCFPNSKGRELLAEDFVFAWKRLANIKYLSNNWWGFDDKIAGLDEFREYTKTCSKEKPVDYSKKVEGLKAIDKYTLFIQLKRPWPQIIYTLASITTSPIAKEAVDYYGKDIGAHPIGTGPYKLKLWNRGSYIEMVRNEKFRDEFYPTEGADGDQEKGLLKDAGKKLPFIDKIFFIIFEETQPQWLQFLRGKIDASGIPKDNFAQAISSNWQLTEQMGNRGITLVKVREPSIFWIGFNMEDPVVGKCLSLRKAISYAIDRKTFIDVFLNGRSEQAFGFIPPVMNSYNPNIKQIGQIYDKQKAIEMAAKAKKFFGGKMPVLTFSMPSADTRYRQMAQFYNKCFKEVGLKVEFEHSDWPTFLAKIKTKSAQMFTMGWIAGSPDVEGFLQAFYSKKDSDNTNDFNYVSDQFNTIYEKVKVMDESPKRIELYRKAEKIVLEDCPLAVTTHRTKYILYHDWLKNYKLPVFVDGTVKYQKINIQKRNQYKAK